ncbi:hypothetical protein DEO72_LG3g1711 [Vigna unguiculata]|uniref:Uncharacterized protein n=1 Tax=Vigna unguiculata TaxID=3917 RepID=A0A4D6LF41_VIGUN|nr:hypothetical protein DEO72_LG3g1711 [Vigna unguiculata]
MHCLVALAYPPDDKCRSRIVVAELATRGNLVRGQWVACGAWWYVSTAKRFGSAIRLAAWEQGQAIMQMPDLHFVALDNVFLKLWLGIRVKHVAFLGLWLKMTSLELWLGMADEHEELLSCGSGWRVLSVVCSVAWFPARALLVMVGRYGSKTP